MTYISASHDHCYSLRTYHKFQTDSTQCTKITNIWMASLISHIHTCENGEALYMSVVHRVIIRRRKYPDIAVSRINVNPQIITHQEEGNRIPQKHLVPISYPFRTHFVFPAVLYGVLLESIKAEANHLEVNPIPLHSFLCHPYR